MFHHLDLPIARQNVRLDITNLYVFDGQTGTVFAMTVCHSIADPQIPGFHPEGIYEFKIDLDGDTVEDLTYRFAFAERDRQGRQSFVLIQLTGAAGTDPFVAGTTIASGSTDETVIGDHGVRAWAGRAGDPFWVELDVLRAVGHALQDGTKVELGEWRPDRAANFFAGHTVHSIVLEVPGDQVESTASHGRIGAWAVASVRTDADKWRSINRVGLPMMHLLLTQYNEDLGTRLDAGDPSDDFATYGETLIGEVAGVVGAYGTAENPRAYAERVAHVALPNVLPYLVGTAAAFGFAERNGRSLSDNAPDVMFTIAFNTPIHLGIGKESVASKPVPVFPYVPLVP